MFARDSGGGGSEFASSLCEKLDRFGELYLSKRKRESIGGSPSRPDLLPSDAEILESVSTLSTHVWPFLDAEGTSDLANAIVPDAGLIERLTDEPLEGGGGNGSRIEDALGWIHDGVEIVWEGNDADQFRIYCGTVERALHRQELLIKALRALVDVHGRIVDRTRQDLLDLLDSANAELDDAGDGGLGMGLTLIGTAFAICATVSTGNPAIGYGIASALAGAAASFTSGNADEVGSGVELGFGPTASDIMSRTIELVEELKTEAQRKNEDLRAVVTRLGEIIDNGTPELKPAELVPVKPNIYHSYEPINFKLPDYIHARP